METSHNSCQMRWHGRKMRVKTARNHKQWRWKDFFLNAHFNSTDVPKWESSRGFCCRPFLRNQSSIYFMIIIPKVLDTRAARKTTTPARRRKKKHTPYNYCSSTFFVCVCGANEKKCLCKLSGTETSKTTFWPSLDHRRNLQVERFYARWEGAILTMRLIFVHNVYISFSFVFFFFFRPFCLAFLCFFEVATRPAPDNECGTF